MCASGPAEGPDLITSSTYMVRLSEFQRPRAARTYPARVGIGAPCDEKCLSYQLSPVRARTTICRLEAYPSKATGSLAHKCENLKHGGRPNTRGLDTAVTQNRKGSRTSTR